MGNRNVYNEQNTNSVTSQILSLSTATSTKPAFDILAAFILILAMATPPLHFLYCEGTLLLASMCFFEPSVFLNY